MSKKCQTITAESFPRAVERAYVLDRKMKAHIHGQTLLLLLGSVLFAAQFFLLALGGLYAGTVNEAGAAAFDAVPFVTQYWNGVWGWLGGVTDSLYLQIALVVVYAFLLPFAVCSVVAAIVLALTKGEKATFTGNEAQQAKQLYAYVDGMPFHKTDAGDAQRLWRILTGVLSAVGMAVFWAYFFMLRLNISGGLGEALKFFLATEEFVVVLVMGFVYFLLYSLSYRLFCAMIGPYYRGRNRWWRFKEAVEAYWVSVDCEEQKRREEAAAREPYDGWKYKNLTKTAYYKEKKAEYYAGYMGLPYESDEDRAKRLVREVEEDLSGSGNGDY